MADTADRLLTDDAFKSAMFCHRYGLPLTGVSRKIVAAAGHLFPVRGHGSSEQYLDNLKNVAALIASEIESVDKELSND